MQRKYELLAIAQGREEELADAIEGGPRVLGGDRRIGHGEAERAVDERAEQIFAGREVAVDGADADTGARGDLGHRDLLALLPDEFDRRVQDSLAIAECVLALLAGDGSRHFAIIAAACGPISWVSSIPGTKRTKSSGTDLVQTRRAPA